MELIKICEEFLYQIDKTINKDQLYNEASFQHELAVHLKNQGHTVHFEIPMNEI
ncbi:MAG: hypothetical protein ACRCTJ_01870 [Brevinema sp.]